MEFDSIKEIENKIIEKSESSKEKSLRLLEEIISDLPENHNQLINQAFEYKRIPKEYLFSSILFAYSNACGLAFCLNSMGFKNYGNLYLSLIGSRGDMKSPAMELATEPLNQYDSIKYREFKNKLKETEFEEPTIRRQLLIQDATIEAAYLKHYQNPCSLGIYVDELYQLIEKMGNPSSKDGPAWRTFFLQGNTNKHIDISRKTVESFRLDKSYPVLLGSIQTEFSYKIFGGGNLESGLVDRILFTDKLTKNSHLSGKDINLEVQKTYKDNLLRILDLRKEWSETNHEDTCIRISCTPAAELKLKDYSQYLLNLQEESNPTMEAYISKMMINIHKVALVLHTMKESQHAGYKNIIEEHTMIESIRIMKFYQLNFENISEKYAGKDPVKLDQEAVLRKGKENGATCEQIAAVLGVNKSTVSRNLKKLKL
ncbi:DUF3987 domain-containing protein [Christiangramia marina]|uniref:DUF3987 domain-containing protein n=1 Tax=Christiangramia marina TaxID=409436 RepID=UPI003AA88C70